MIGPTELPLASNDPLINQLVESHFQILAMDSAHRSVVEGDGSFSSFHRKCDVRVFTWTAGFTEITTTQVQLAKTRPALCPHPDYLGNFPIAQNRILSPVTVLEERGHKFS